MGINNKEKITPLISLYKQAFEEIKRYRDMEWKIPSWTVVLMAGTVAATRLALVQQAHKPYVQTLLCLFTIVAALYGIWHIHFVHTQFVWSRNLLRRCERVFGFFDNTMYDDEPILPKEWKEADYRYAQAWRHLVS